MKTHAIEQQATAVDIPKLNANLATVRSKGTGSSKGTRLFALAALALVGLLLAQTPRANAQNNLGPPYGAIFDLAGQQLPSSWQQYSKTFTLASAESTLTFLLRNDPAFTALNDVSLQNSQGTEMLTHGDFEDGGASWTTVNQYGAAFSGVFSTGCDGVTGGGIVWCDGSVQAYDAISQGGLNLQPGQYTLSFWLDTSNGCGTCDFRDLSNNGQSGTGGNGIDVLAYVGSGPPAPAPEPSSLALLGSGIVGLFGMLRRKLNR